MTELIEKAIRRSTELYKGKKNIYGTLPYIIHPIDVLKTLYDWGIDNDESLLAASILHNDIYDYSEKEIQEIRTEFNDAVAIYLEDISKKKNVSKRQHMFNYGKETTVGAVIIELSDRVCHFKDFWNVGRQPKGVHVLLQAYPIYSWLLKNDYIIQGMYSKQVFESIHYIIHSLIFNHIQHVYGKEVIELILNVSNENILVLEKLVAAELA